MASFHNDIFSGSSVDRYADPADKAPTVPRLYVNDPNAVDWQQRDRDIAEAINKDKDGSTLVGWMNTVEDKIRVATGHLANGDVLAARTIDDEIREVTNANIGRITQYSGLYVQPGSLAERMKNIATMLRDGTYSNNKVNFFGAETTYGEVLRAPGGDEVVNKAVSDSLRTFGYDSSFSSMMLDGTKKSLGENPAESYVNHSDTTFRDCAKFLTGNDMKAAAYRHGVDVRDETRALRVGMANELTADWKGYFDTFGGATTDFVTRAFDAFGGCGGERMMPAMRDYAVRVHASTGFTGKQLVNEVFRQYTDWRVATSRSLMNTKSGSKVDVDDVGTYEQNAALSGAIAALSRSDVNFSLDNPVCRRRAAEFGSCIARLKAAGVNYVAEARKAGTDVNTDMASRLLGVHNPGSSIDNIDRYFTDMKRYTGGRDFAEAVYTATQSASDYYASVARQNGGESTCPGADAMLASVMRARTGFLVPRMIRDGASVKDAMSAVRTDRRAASEYFSAVAGSFASFLPGKGANEAASALALHMFMSEADANGGAVNMQDLLESAANTGSLNGKTLSKEAQASLQGWVSGNVTDAALFTPEANRMRLKLKELGIDPVLTESLVSQASYEASTLKRNSSPDYLKPFHTWTTDLTRYPVQKLDSNGRLLETKMAVGHADRLNGEFVVRGQTYKIRPGDYSSNPAMFQGIFQNAEEEGKELDANNMLIRRAYIQSNKDSLDNPDGQ